ncbi:hypothetical protein L596_017744 [Steinernema carpocapsae]|uniref:Uncharacterized protein n=1 Tax=Steinernema carpocapsae TaxID=34508 RepID=A0A4U5N2T7_STECR|nr:hypothetical protein L596_017744 [Steinernema carpocapsae]
MADITMAATISSRWHPTIQRNSCLTTETSEVTIRTREPVIDDAMGTAVVDHRFRCYSVSSEPHNQSSEGSVSGSEDDNEMERDFEADFESVKLERFDSMSRDEVTRAMLQMEKSHGDLADHVVELRCENDRLKKLLNENGIAFDHHTLGRRRRSSNESSLGSNGSASNSNNEDNKPEE